MRTEVLVLDSQDEEPFEDENPWYFDIKNYCRNQSFPEYATADDKKILKRIAQRYRIIGGVLHRKAFSGIYVRCITEEEALRIMEAVHASECGGNFSVQTLCKAGLKTSYW